MRNQMLILLTKNCQRRLGVKGLEEVTRHPFFASNRHWDTITDQSKDR